ncbi:4-hydroxythreonine-4-phosphate dehydrogenase PdxA [Brevundimonas halotolerans]|uniref:4-hydroxythreonine-4-phosphate dehydrogenase n=1 Tax=Brevundimonas halotolerans TaxID=69670 RepID=A0A7W9A3N3_9CAUL|nr:4-hydroxythreonine-4-phosphate dehydrogenase PdxA [Brevundimonas halotolerans]MBB5660851.1 4-hydroxythreonine-4-phosphate dehydrogenase [Brevundimonas halotolerans]
MTRPVPPLALTMGEPAGVGPEIIAAAWKAHLSPFVVVGDARLMATHAPVEVVTDPASASAVFDRAIPVLDQPLSAPVTPGQPDPAHASAITGWIETAVRLCLDRAVAGMVTAPIAKAPLYQAGFRFPGHTEFIAELTADAPWGQTRGPVMMLTAKDLRACLVTIHTPLSQVPEMVTAERVSRVARVVHEALIRDFGIACPRLALAGLNPHAGEGGSIGLEEQEVLIPAATALRAEGLDISDPRPADTLFHDEARTTYDAVLCLYHDQALIPVKTLDFWGGVNVSLGLPVVRTSPDHGTGFDIAGRGIARPDSLIAALHLARTMADRRAAAV